MIERRRRRAIAVARVVLEVAAIAFACAVVVAAVGCTGKRPPAVDPRPPGEVDPTPGPVAQVGHGLECRAGQFVRPDGSPFTPKGCSGCCGDGAEGWPCGSANYLAWLAEAGGCNLFEFRLGFTRASEPEWSAIGGDFLEDAAGRADLTKPNPAFEARIEQAIAHADTIGGVVFLDAFDGWRIKHCQAGDDVGCFMAPAGNVQGVDWLTNAGRVELKDGTYWAERLRYLVRRFGRNRNVGWLLGNENGQIAGFVPEWDLGQRNVIRDEYARQGWAQPVIVTNSDSSTVETAPGVDVVAKHVEGVIARVGDRCTMNTEYNPATPWSAKVWRSIAKQTADAGATLWAWRHGQDFDTWLATLAASKAGLEGVSADPCPFPVAAPAFVYCKPHTAWGPGWRFDCTPQRVIAPAGGMPLWPEDALREACEAKSCGGAPTFTLEAPTGTLRLEAHPNPWQFVLIGAGAGVLHCTVPARPGVDLCGYQVSR